MKLQLGLGDSKSNSPDGKQFVEFSLGQITGFENMSKKHMK